jgi:hypothetical protein
MKHVRIADGIDDGKAPSAANPHCMRKISIAASAGSGCSSRGIALRYHHATKRYELPHKRLAGIKNKTASPPPPQSQNPVEP